MMSETKAMKEAIERIKRNPNVVRPSIGVFAGIYDIDGNVLLERRGQNETLPGDWDLPGGEVRAVIASMSPDERLIGQELERKVFEKTGISISVERMPEMYPAVMKGGADWAFVIPIGEALIPSEISGKEGKLVFVSPEELLELAQRSEGNRLVSGVGKRMHRLALMALCCGPNHNYRFTARKMLEEINEATTTL